MPSSTACRWAGLPPASYARRLHSHAPLPSCVPASHCQPSQPQQAIRLPSTVLVPRLLLQGELPAVWGQPGAFRSLEFLLLHSNDVSAAADVAAD